MAVLHVSLANSLKTPCGKYGTAKEVLENGCRVDHAVSVLYIARRGVNDWLESYAPCPECFAHPEVELALLGAA